MTRHRTERLTTAVFVSVIGLLLSLFTGRAEIAVLTAPWLVLLVAGLMTTRRPRVDLSVSPAFERSTAGERVDVTYTFKASDRPSDGDALEWEAGKWEAGKWQAGRLAGTLYATWPDLANVDADVRAARTVARSLWSGAPVEVVVPFKAERWGTYDVGRVHINFIERFGLFAWSADLAKNTPIRIHPDELQLRELVAPSRLRRQTGAHQSRSAGRGLEFAGIRPHTSGDSIREVNWRASARSQDLWVSQRHPDRSTDVVLLIDSFPESYGLDQLRPAMPLDQDNLGRGNGQQNLVSQSELLTAVIRMAMALASRYLSMTDRVGLVELGGIVRWVGPAAGRLQLHRLIDAALATAPYRSWAKRDLSVVPRRAIPPSAMVIAISPLVDDRFTQAVVELAASGQDVAVLALDASLPTGTPDAVRMIWQAEREAARHRLTSSGIAAARWDSGMTADSGLQLALDELERRRRGLRTGLRS